MGMKKPSSTAVAPTPATAVAEAPKVTTPITPDSGVAAAANRLQKKAVTTTVPASTAKSYGNRDFDKEARGKSKCLLYGHAIGSALIAGTKFEDLEGAFKNMKFFVDKALVEIFAE